MKFTIQSKLAQSMHGTNWKKNISSNWVALEKTQKLQILGSRTKPNFQPSMDMLCKRFPLVKKRILNNLDDQSLTRSKEANREIAEFLDNGRFYWIRIIKKYAGNFEGFEESWKEVIPRTPLDIVKQLALAVEEFFKSYSFKQVAPLHIVAEKGTLQLCQYIITKAKYKNPQGKLGILLITSFQDSSCPLKFSKYFLMILIQ